MPLEGFKINIMGNTSWATVASLLIDIVQDGTPEGKTVAREELIKIGEKLDKVNASPEMKVFVRTNVMDESVEFCSKDEAESILTVRVTNEKVLA